MKTLGLDLGIKSVGWALIESDENRENYRILDLGIRLFSSGQAIENGKVVGPPALPRREARSSRRTIRRKRARLIRIKKFLHNYGLIKNIKDLFYNNKITDVWELRALALNEPLSPEDFSRILIHIAKHRGYMMSVDSDDDEIDGDKDGKKDDKKKIKKAIAETERAIKELNYRTYGEYVYKSALDSKKPMRNRGGEYRYFPSNNLLKKEIDIIFKKQFELGNKFATEELKNKYWEIASSIKDSKSFEDMVGACTFFKDEKRAPKNCYSAEKFVLLTSILNTVVIDEDLKEIKIINIKHIDEIINFAENEDGGISYKKLRKFLSIPDTAMFKGISYEKKKKAKGKKETDPEDKVFVNMYGLNALKKICGEKIAKDKGLSLKIMRVLTYFKGVEQRRSKLLEIEELNADMASQLAKLENIKEFVSLSAKAIEILLPYMESGLRYDEAVKTARIDGKIPYEENLKQDLLPALDPKTNIRITNPTVLRTLSEARKVINAVIRKYGKLDRVNIELARDIKTKKERLKAIQTQNKNIESKKQAEQLLKEKDLNNPSPKKDISKKDILKARLYNQQDGISLYSGEPIKLERLTEDGYCQIDHILPRFKSMDNSFNNKVLCLAEENQNKANDIPYDWLSKTGQFDEFKARVLSMKDKLSYQKVKRLLTEKIDAEGFIERDLNDTRYASRTLKKYLETYLKIGEDDNKVKVLAVNGYLTAELRHQWGLEKDRDANDIHHAVDAVVIALANAGIVKKLANYYKEREYRKHPKFTEPLENFRKVLNEKLVNLPVNRLLVSRPPRKKVTGQAHKETVISPKNKDHSMIEIHKGRGYAEQSLMPRVDVFKKGGKFYYVPIYVADFAKKELPNKIITIGKEKNEWNVADDSYEFLFSLFKDDLIKFKQKGKAEVMGYFLNIGISNCQITYQNINGSKEKNSKGKEFDPYFGGTTLEYIKKYQIDPLGFYYEIKKERRLPVSMKKNN